MIKTYIKRPADENEQLVFKLTHGFKQSESNIIDVRSSLGKLETVLEPMEFPRAYDEISVNRVRKKVDHMLQDCRASLNYLMTGIAQVNPDVSKTTDFPLYNKDIKSYERFMERAKINSNTDIWKLLESIQQYNNPKTSRWMYNLWKCSNSVKHESKTKICNIKYEYGNGALIMSEGAELHFHDVKAKWIDRNTGNETIQDMPNFNNKLTLKTFDHKRYPGIVKKIYGFSLMEFPITVTLKDIVDGVVNIQNCLREYYNKQ